MACARSRDFESAGSKMAANIPMMAITTNSSISVKPRRFRRPAPGAVVIEGMAIMSKAEHKLC